MGNGRLMRYLIGCAPDLPGSSIAMAFEGDDEEVLPRMWKLMKEGPAICWQVTKDSPFHPSRMGQ